MASGSTLPIPAETIVGFRVVAHGGTLGFVVERDRGAPPRQSDADGAEVVVRGGVSRSLFYYLPADAFRSISISRAEIIVDCDVSDFTPKLRADGSVDLRLR